MDETKLSMGEKFLSMFAEKVGAGLSSSRVLTTLVVVNGLIMADYLVFKNHSLPDLSALTEFVVAIVGALYGVNKVSSIFINKNGQ